MSLGRMGEISDISRQELHKTYQNFFRMETLKEYNNIVANASANLSIFRYYDIKSDVIHSSSDEQRFEAQKKHGKCKVYIKILRP